jgi:8-oxo-dGTP pyrophosphatase MutT (NUDIX family)
MVVSLKTIEAALMLPDFDEYWIKEAREIMMPTPPLQRSPDLYKGARVGSVLILFYQVPGQTNLVLTRRRADLRTHAGQISFPGGRRDGEETLAQTALRETEEEIGVASDAIRIIGALMPAYVPPSNFFIYPFVGWYQDGLALNGRPTFQKNPAEVAEIVEIPVYRLLDKSVRHEEPRYIKEILFSFPYYAIDQYKIWGATASILSEVVERLRYVINGPPEAL